MTYVILGTSGTALSQGSYGYSYAAAVTQRPTILNTADSAYNRETVTKILAARRGASSIVPADRDQLRDWLNT